MDISALESRGPDQDRIGDTLSMPGMEVSWKICWVECVESQATQRGSCTLHVHHRTGQPPGILGCEPEIGAKLTSEGKKGLSHNRFVLGLGDIWPKVQAA